MNHKRNENMDIVDRALAELQQTPVPPGPPREIVDKALRAGDSAVINPKRTIMERLVHMKYWKKTIITAAAAAIVIAAVAVWMHMPNGSVPSFTGITFADVQRQMQNCKTFSCILHVTGSVIMSKVEGGEKMTKEEIEKKMMEEMRKERPKSNLTIKIFVKEPNLVRMEVLEESENPVFASGIHIITDSKKGKSILVIPEAKAYGIGNSPFSPIGFMTSSYKQGLREIKKMIQSNDTKPLGEKTIDGRKAKGYEVNIDGGKGEVWADAETAVPIQISCSDGENTSSMTDIRVNEPLDDSLFSMEIPESYKNMDDKPAASTRK